MKHARRISKVFLVIMVLCATGSWLWPQEAPAAVQRKGIRVDAGSSQTISFTVPANTPKTWIRIITDPGITPLWYSLERGADPVVTIKSTDGANQVKPVPDGLLNPIADAIYQLNVPAVNVYSIALDHSAYRTTFPMESWTLTVQNKSSAMGIFAVYISSVSAAETEGGDAWLRDNATVDPSGYHTLSNINNLDTTEIPTPSEWWKSPSIRFTDQYGTPTKNPVGGQSNNVYIKVHNFGTQPISSVTIEAYWTHFTTSLPAFPSAEWNPLGTQTVTNIDPGTSRETGAFVWNVPPVPPPTQPNHYCIFARTTASVGALDPINYSNTVVDWLTPNNTNATHRNVMIISAVDPPPAGPFPFFIKPPLRFYVANPTKLDIVADLQVKGLPAVARASQIMVAVQPDERFELVGLKTIEGEKPVQETAAGKTTMKTATVETPAGPVPAGMRAFSIIDNERISLGGIRLKAGEKRLVEFQLALAEPVKGPQEITVDAIQTSGGKTMGGVTAVLDIAGPKAKWPCIPWYVPVLLTIVILILIVLVVKRKPAR
ncbi:MAG TPA: hypothetical protein VMU60_05435 [Syntrophobacteria bacterium]|nr:hypothetical protein [Syntrophobacteria bacterium]